MNTSKTGHVTLVVFAVCINFAAAESLLGQDKPSGKNQKSLRSDISTRANTVDDYLRGLPSLTADGQLSLDARKSKLIPATQQIAANRPDEAKTTAKSVSWMTPGLCFKHTYFEDNMLERNGNSRGFFQPAHSISRLMIQTSVYPIRRTLDVGRPCECFEVDRFSSHDLD